MNKFLSPALLIEDAGFQKAYKQNKTKQIAKD